MEKVKENKENKTSIIHPIPQLDSDDDEQQIESTTLAHLSQNNNKRTISSSPLPQFINNSNNNPFLLKQSSSSSLTSIYDHTQSQILKHLLPNENIANNDDGSIDPKQKLIKLKLKVIVLFFCYLH